MPAHDEVDEIIAQWVHVRPDADVAPFAVLSRLTRLARRLQRVRAAAFADAGIEAWEWDVLAALRRADAALTPKELIAQTMVTSGTMTNRIDNLVGRGLVERIANDADRRSTRIRLTDDGLDRVDSALDALLDAEHRVLAAMGHDDRRRLAGLLRDVGHGLDAGPVLP
ncbi:MULTISPECIES: MarR family winged helix-turn-helix transcriptional regulator [unclassified Agrococcus]|uniref:MarR family winged helix-turn-helix transcriptional regulator n=1 Tax=unclassified Agrococcus TaxID=2615065 RepID=UPI003620B1B4